LVYREFEGLKLSEMGIGTYLGDTGEEKSSSYIETLRSAIGEGINVIDTAINYRYMRSERDVGRAIKGYDRASLVISTKGGYVPYDVDSGQDPKDYFIENFTNNGLIKREEMTPQGHCLGVEFLRWCFDKSLENMGTDYIDVYFIHNPEEELLFFDRDVVMGRLREAFLLMEELVSSGKLRYYGVATWNAFRISRGARQYISLQELVDLARSVAGDTHHFKVIQLPYNMGMPEAYTLRNQEVGGRLLSPLQACTELGLYVYTSATLYQGNVIGRVPDRLKEVFGLDRDVHVAQQFVRSTPGIGTFLVGTSSLEHLWENLSLLKSSDPTPEAFLSLFK
jgi:aryl-alcohol dehydrogenase-like predicted oxidoreductase